MFVILSSSVLVQYYVEYAFKHKINCESHSLSAYLSTLWVLSTSSIQYYWEFGNNSRRCKLYCTRTPSHCVIRFLRNELKRHSSKCPAYCCFQMPPIVPLTSCIPVVHWVNSSRAECTRLSDVRCAARQACWSTSWRTCTLGSCIASSTTGQTRQHRPRRRRLPPSSRSLPPSRALAKYARSWYTNSTFTLLLSHSH